MTVVKIIKFVSPIFIVLTISACSSFGYYMDLMSGHSELLEQRRPISEILEDKETAPELRNLLVTSENIREYASKVLHLPENNSYRQYADLKRKYAVWNVVAAKEFSIQPKKWCFLFVGCLSYRGYFSKSDAADYADELKKEGYDVYLVGAKAYSTLGWFDDPLLNTMLYKSEARRAGIIFHELAHQVVYIENDSAFNEAFATTVEEEGIRRWMEQKGKDDQYQKYIINKKRDTEINQLLQETRNKLKELYKAKISDKEKRQDKKEIFSVMQKEYAQLKKSWGGYDAYDQWMQQELNNAHLLLISTYHDLVPTFKNILKKEKYNLRNFYSAVEKYGSLNKKDRKIKLIQTATIK